MSIFWFRKGLRLHDNPALVQCVKSSPKFVAPIYILEPYQLEKCKQGVLPWQFLLETLHDLDQSLQTLGSRLILFRGDPSFIMSRLIDEWKPSSVYYEVDHEPYPMERDTRIRDMARQKNVTLRGIQGHLLYDPDDILHRNKGKAPLTFQGFVKHAEGIKVPPVVETPTSLPPLPNVSNLADVFALKEDGGALDTKHPLFEWPGGETKEFNIPSLEDLGFPPVEDSKQSRFKGGETKALEALEVYFRDKKRVALFEKPKTSPAAFRPPATTVLSPHLRHGSLSCRLFYHRLMEVYMEFKKHSCPPVSLLAQLYWREFYYTVAVTTPNYSVMIGNPASLQIDWWCKDGPTDTRNPLAEKHLEAWKNGQTGFPWIDAIMTQLRTEGWIHHLARHSVACFLTRGDLFISWERGAEVFEELLLDYDWSLNVGNWLWLSASAFFHQYYRVYSPMVFPKQFDKRGDYVRKFIPRLAKFPAEYIYEPWKAPLSVQKSCGCIIGKDYPAPIVDHATVSKENIERMKAAYGLGKKGVPSDVARQKRVISDASNSSAKRTKV